MAGLARIVLYIYVVCAVLGVLSDVAKGDFGALLSGLFWLGVALAVLWWLRQATGRGRDRATVQQGATGGTAYRDLGSALRDLLAPLRRWVKGTPRAPVVPVWTPRQPHELAVRWEEGVRIATISVRSQRPDGTWEDISHQSGPDKPFEGIPDPDAPDTP